MNGKFNSITIKYPGQLLAEEISKIGMSQKELAIRTNVTEKHISTVVKGTKPISVSFSKKLSYVLPHEPQYWANLQNEYDIHMLAIEEENGITEEELEILRQLKDIEECFLDKGFIHNDCGKPQKIIQWRECLGVSNLATIPQITYNAAYRAQIQKNSKVNPYVLFAWQRMCELMCEKTQVNVGFSEDLLIESISAIKYLISSEKDINLVVSKLYKIFSDCGIVFNVVKHFKGAPVQGFIKQLDDKIILCLTIRGCYADRFWFTLFHEIGHIINGDLNIRFVDFDTVSNEVEEKANKFAADTLIEPSLFNEFVKTGLYDRWGCIEKFANKANVPPIIVLGRLRKEKLLDWSDFTEHNVMYKWSEK